MNTVSVSVVIPAYRAARTISRALDSVFKQTVQPAEVLVVDDGSPDSNELSAAIQPYGPLVSLLKKPNGGAASARNFGIDHAREEWIAFLDADDYWESAKLEQQLQVAAKYPDVGVIGCRWYEEIPGLTRTKAAAGALKYADKLTTPVGSEAFEIAMIMWTGSLLVRRSALADLRFVSGLEPAEDRDLWIRLSAANKVFILSDLLATYVQEEGGISRSDIDKDCSNMMKVVHRHKELLVASGVKTQEAIVYRRWAAGHLAQGRPAKALPYALNRLQLQPASLQAWWIVVKSFALSCIHK